MRPHLIFPGFEFRSVAFFSAAFRGTTLAYLAIFTCFLFGANSAAALSTGDRVRTNGVVNVRSTPAGTSLGTQSSGVLGTIIGGPTTATLSGTSFTWWNVNFDSGLDGWVASIGIDFVPPAAPAPSISSVSPSSPTGSNSSQAFFINGSNFVSGCNVTLRDTTAGQVFSNRSITSFSSSQIRIDPNFTTAAHSWSVEIINSDGQTTGQFSFSVHAPAAAPSISSVSPSPVTGSNSTQAFFINGANFVSGCNVTLRDVTAGQIFANRSITSFSSSQIRIDPNFNTTAHSWSVEIINPDGQTSGQFNFTVQAPAAAPSISSVSPSPVTGSNSTQAFFINGSNFVSGCNVTLRDITAGQTFANRSITSFSSSQIRIDPNFNTTAHSWSVEIINPDGQTSGQFNFAVQAPAAAPSISSVSPSPVTGSNSTQAFFINGSNFVSGCNVTLRDITAGQTFANRSITSFSSSQIRIDPNFNTTAHSWSVEVINSDGQTSGQFNFAVQAPAVAPSISGVSPASMPGLNGDQALTINGSGFTSGDTLTFTPAHGSAITSNPSKLTVISSTQISYQINNANDVGTWTVTVNSPDNSQHSSPASFAVTAAAAPAPTITGVSPASMPGLNGDQPLTINGTNFQAGDTLTFAPAHGSAINSNASKLTVVSSTQIVYQINNANDAGSWSVTVNSPDNSQHSSPSGFTVTTAAAAPTISNVSPASMPGLSGEQTLTINGTGFLAGDTLTFSPAHGSAIGSTASKLAVVSATQITYQINNANDVGNWSVTVNSPDNSQHSSPFTFAVISSATAPTITGVTPATMPGLNSDQSLTINGTGFLSGDTLTFAPAHGSAIASTASKLTVVSATQIIYQINNANDVGTWTVTVNSPDNSLHSSPASFAVAAGATAPTITGVSPASMPGLNGDQTLTINGTGFQAGDTLTFAPAHGGPIASSAGKLAVVSATQITYQINNANDVGNWTVTVNNPDNSQHSSPAGFAVTSSVSSAPTITGVSPLSMTGQNGDQPLLITGTNFQAGDTLTFSPAHGSPINSTSSKLTVVSSTQITYQVNNAGDVGTWTVTVNSPDGSQHSSPASFAVTSASAAAPTITDVSPASMPGLNGDQTLTLTGTNFQTGDTLTFIPAHGSAIASTASKLTVVTSTKITYQINNANDVGAWSVSVNTPDNSQHSSPANFTVTSTVATTPLLTVVASKANPLSAASSGSIVFTVTSSGSADVSWYAAVSSGSWLTIPPGTSGKNNGTFTATYSANPGTLRPAVVAVTPTGGSQSATVIVTQASGIAGTAATPLAGNGDWIHVIKATLADLSGKVSNVDELVAYEKSKGMQFLIVKVGEGDHYYDNNNVQQVAAIISKCHDPQINMRVLGYHYIYGGSYQGLRDKNGKPQGYDEDSSVDQEVVIAKQILGMGFDGLVIDAEDEYEDNNRLRVRKDGTPPPISAATAAQQYMDGIRGLYKDAFVAYAPYFNPAGHSGFPYRTFGKNCQAVIPQAYQGFNGLSGAQTRDRLDSEWSALHSGWIANGYQDSVKPLFPAVWADGSGDKDTVSGASIISFVQLLNADLTFGGFNGVSFWVSDAHHTDDVWNSLAGIQVGSTTTTAAAFNRASPSSGVVNSKYHFSVSATGSPTPTITLKTGALPPGLALSASGEITGTPSKDGSFTATLFASNGVGSPATMDVTIPISRSFAGNYFPAGAGSSATNFVIEASGVTPGTLVAAAAGDGNWAIAIKPDNTGTYISYLSQRQSAIIQDIVVDANGQFSVGGSEIRPANAGAATQSLGDSATGGIRAAAAATFTLTGQISNGTVVGQLVGLGVTFSGAADLSTGPTQVVAGFYSAAALNSSGGATYTVAGASGQAVVVTSNSVAVDGGVGTVNSTGQVSITTASGAKVSAAIDPASQNITASVTPAANGSAPVTFAGVSATVPISNRLVNISTRGVTGTNTQVLIAGFVISGTAPKQVLIRAVGPGLGAFGVIGALANPKLQLYRGDGSLLTENDDWGSAANATDVSLASVQVGAFPLAPASKDSALLLTIDPGSYTAIASGADNGTGVSLVEVYETLSSADAPKLINISTRGQVNTDGGVLIAGFVVTGNAPKKVLIRAIGPTLGAFSVAGALADPILTLFDSKSAALATNDNWGSAGDGAAISSAAAQVGAFGLTPGSKDASLLVTLQPGAYTAQAAGVSRTTGVALIEVYEVP